MGFLQNILEADKNLFLSLNAIHSDFWDTIMLMVTRKETWIPFYAILVFYIFRNYRSKTLPVLFFLALTILLSDQLSVLIKDSVQRLRPVHDPVLGPLVHNVLRKGNLYGFVSSHATNSFAIFIFTSRLFKNKGYSLLILFWALVFSYSRIYSGVHYPLDILGGFVLGWLVGYLCYRMLMFTENHFFIARLPRIQKARLSNEQAWIVLLVFVVLVTTVFTVSGILHHYQYL
jgi:undecaprenyl-diphosphatase